MKAPCMLSHDCQPGLPDKGVVNHINTHIGSLRTLHDAGKSASPAGDGPMHLVGRERCLTSSVRPALLQAATASKQCFKAAGARAPQAGRRGQRLVSSLEVDCGARSVLLTLSST